MKIAILGTRGIPNNYGGFEQCAEYLSVGLTKKGHKVTVYSPDFHPYKDDEYKGVKIIRKSSPQQYLGSSVSNFLYDYYCFKDAAKKDFDIILELGLITASLSIIFINHRNKIVATNIDGLEWKRLKWSGFVQKITKALEKYGIKHSDYLIADNIGIQEYIRQEYGRNSKYISYGAVENLTPNPNCLSFYEIIQKEYLLTIARLEPENNLEIMFDGYIKSNCTIPYIIVGNHLTEYGDFLKDKYRNTGIKFLGGIYNKVDLDNLRHYSKFYLHGHSVGGTNPALLEAMAASCFIIAHNNQFNKSVLEDNSFYFDDANTLTNLLNNNALLEKKNQYTSNNLNKIKKVYAWENIVNQYESYFKTILDSQKRR
ncbi:MAG: DUF1972 domain-containing protein [Flavobacteriales bacterium]|nr:DUF1972 domain-containing protein [Flavobacteriales bacterium]